MDCPRHWVKWARSKDFAVLVFIPRLNTSRICFCDVCSGYRYVKFQARVAFGTLVEIQLTTIFAVAVGPSGSRWIEREGLRANRDEKEGLQRAGARRKATSRLKNL